VEKISKEKHSFIDRFVRNPRSLQCLFLCHIDKSCKAKQGNDLCCPYHGNASQNRHQKVFNRGALRLCEGVDILKID